MAKQTNKAKATTTVEPFAAAVQLPEGSELLYIINDDTGEIRQAVTRAGYAPAPMPFGFRLARANEVPTE